MVIILFIAIIALGAITLLVMGCTYAAPKNFAHDTYSTSSTGSGQTN